MTSDHLVLRTGKQADEFGPEEPKHDRFGGIEVEAPLREATWIPKPIPRVRRVPGHSYEARLFDVDDQEDLLLDGRKIASAGYLQTSPTLDLRPFLAPGPHRVALRIFNRQLGTCYGVFFQIEGKTVRSEQCGGAPRIMAVAPNWVTLSGWSKS